MPPAPLAVIVNPTAGPASRRPSRERCSTIATRACDAAGLVSEVVFTERPGHARALAGAFAERGFSPVVAWGGDGTVNEVAGALVGRPTAMGIVPVGSGNGLARELGISLRPDQAMDTAARGGDRRIDAGELGGRIFVNMAGVGLAASVAALFARLAGRGLLRYVRATIAEVLSYDPRRYRVTVDGETIERRALLLEIANGRQYGNGALIAPRARLDDGRLDIVVVAPMGPLGVALGVPRLFGGTLDRHPRVEMRTGVEITISSDDPMPFHVDGEPGEGTRDLTARVRPGALVVRVNR